MNSRCDQDGKRQEILPCEGNYRKRAAPGLLLLLVFWALRGIPSWGRRNGRGLQGPELRAETTVSELHYIPRRTFHGLSHQSMEGVVMVGSKLPRAGGRG